MLVLILPQFVTWTPHLGTSGICLYLLPTEHPPFSPGQSWMPCCSLTVPRSWFQFGRAAWVQKQAQPPFMLCVQRVSRELKFPQGGAVQMYTRIGWVVFLWAVGLGAERNGGRGKTKPPSLLIYNGLTQSVWGPWMGREGLWKQNSSGLRAGLQKSERSQ